MDNNKLPFILCGLLFIGVSIYFLAFAPKPVEPISAIDAESARIENATTDGQFAKIDIVTPAQSEYKGSGQKASRTTEIVRIASPFGIGAGETLARQEPVKLTDKDMPGVTTTAEGTTATKGEDSTISTGGFRWSWLDSLWMWIKKIFWFALIGGGILLIVYFLVPGAQPIIGTIFRVIASIFPFLGSLVEKLTATKQLQKPLEETVIGGQNFKDAVDKLPDLTPAQKEKLRDLFNKKMMEKQDKYSQLVIDKIKLARKI